MKDLKSHSELRIYKKGVREPIAATFDEANDERILVVVKNSQMAIPKEEIDHAASQPGHSGAGHILIILSERGRR